MKTEIKTNTFLIVSIIPRTVSDQEAFQDIKELKELVEASGGVVADITVQRREAHDRGLYIGRGKIADIARMVKEQNIDTVVLNEIVKPGQIFEIKTVLAKNKPDIEVWDRVSLILHIFAAHANTAEARLQIELASMHHMGPRIYGMGKVMSRQGGGIGTLGIGETNTELMKRHWRKQIKQVKDKLKKLTLDRERQLARRREVGFQTVSIIGYTNAGKTSLFNLLTGKQNVVNNALFVTLDSSVGNIKLPKSKKTALLSDTIGFIRKLPTELVDAFTSTLLESINADLLLHVIDASDENMRRKIKAVETVLQQLAIRDKKIMLIFSKVDLITEEEKQKIQHIYRSYHPQFISVKRNAHIEELLQKIEEFLTEEPKVEKTTEKRADF